MALVFQTFIKSILRIIRLKGLNVFKSELRKKS